MMFIVFVFLCIFSFTTCGVANITVDANGSGNFKTINDALKASPNRSKDQFRIFIKKGIYNESVHVTTEKQNIVFIGDGMNATVITNDRSHSTSGGTFNSSTLAVDGYGFIAMNLTIKNTAGPLANQSVALRSSANHSAFYKCDIQGYQDTLYAHMNSQFYRECTIRGTVDFIFGAGPAVFQNCQILVRQGSAQQQNTITANEKNTSNAWEGFSIQSSTIAPDSTLTSTTKTYLGRPWAPYSTTVIMQSNITSIVDAAGWLDWNGNKSYEQTVYYVEYENKGLGARTGERVDWPGYHSNVSVQTAEKYTARNFIDGGSWIKATGIPCQLDLNGTTS